MFKEKNIISIDNNVMSSDIVCGPSLYGYPHSFTCHFKQWISEHICLFFVMFSSRSSMV
jgi:hypothetical protein